MPSIFVTRLLALFLSLFASSVVSAKYAKPSDLLDNRIEQAKGVLKPESDARRYDKTVFRFWDELRKENFDFSVFKDFPFNKIELPVFSTPEKRPSRILESVHKRAGSTPNFIGFDSAMGALDRFKEVGFKIEYSNWHIIDLFEDEDGGVRSIVRFEMHVNGPDGTLFRRVLSGELEVLWLAEENEDGLYMPDTISYRELKMAKRSSVKSFERNVLVETRSRESGYKLVLVEDLDDDGYSDIVFPRANKVLRNLGDFSFKESDFVSSRLDGYVSASVLADIDLDGVREYVVLELGVALWVYYKNPKTGKYDKKPKRIFKFKKELGADAISVGDLDGDGLPEIFLGQSRLSHFNGYFPTPYFNANNGRPSFLLKNKGNGNFENITDKSGIADIRNRNVNTSSIFDMNMDGEMDLLVTSEYAGLDAFISQGQGGLAPVESAFDQPRMSGTGHVISDFNGDGNLDVFVSGRTSNSVDRLLNLGINRENEDEYNRMRSVITSGNQLFFGDGNGKYLRGKASSSVSQSGWSWGSAGLDFNNDGFEDIMVSNGNISRESAADYDSEFWAYDIYDGKDADQKVLRVVFDYLGPKAKVFKEGMGWNPFQANRLFLNVEGTEFIDVSYYMDVGYSGDGRAVISEDFDLDGKIDFLLVDLEQIQRIQTVMLYENRVASRNHWIGLRLKESGGKPIIGARVRVESELGVFEKVYTIGNVYSGQDSSQMHFGLGSSDSVEKIEIIWPDGEVTVMESPEIEKYHLVKR